VRSWVRAALYRVDELWCRAIIGIVGDRPGIVSFLFHAVSGSDDVGIDDVVDPGQTLSAEALSSFIAHFKAAGYRFVSPTDVREGLEPDGRYVLMTFDDGYYNNLRMLPVLRAHSVPAVFFISTHHIESGEAFWWDVLYRERRRRGVHEFGDELRRLKGQTHAQIRDYLIAEFGSGALRPVGDEDRPMTPEELRAFAREPWVHIGNHTTHHAILTNYPYHDVEAQIRGAQDWLEGTLGQRPIMISYPNGNVSDEAVQAAIECGLDMGVSLEAHNTSLPLSSEARMRIGRFCFTRGQESETTYLTFRSPISLRRTIQALARRVRSVPTAY